MVYLSTDIFIISWQTEALWKKNKTKKQGNKIKDSVEAYDIN